MEIARNSGVPRSKIYGTLRGMKKKGYVQIIEGKPTFFYAVQPEELIFRIKADFIHSLNEIVIELNASSLGSNAFFQGNIQSIKAKI